MTLDQLYSVLPASGPVTIDGNLIGNPAVDPVILANLYRANIILEVSQKTSQTDQNGNITRIQLVGSLPSDLGSSFLGIVKNLAAVVFFQPADLIELVMTVQLNLQTGNVAVPWDFSVSYPNFQLTSASKLPASNQHFYLATAPTEGLAQGLTYDGLIALTGPYFPMQGLEYLGVLDPGYTRTMSGLIEQVPGSQQGISMRGLTLPFPLEIDLVALQARNLKLVFELQTTPVESDQFVVSASYGVVMDAIIGTQAMVGLQAWVLLETFANARYVQLAIMPLPSDSRIISLNDLGELMGGNTWNDLFTGFSANFQDLFNEFGFLSWSASINFTSTPTVTNTLLRAGTDNKTYVLIPDYVQLNYLETRWLVMDPFASGLTSFTLVAELALPNSNIFDVAITVDSSANLALEGVLKGAIPLDVADWAASLWGAFTTDPFPDTVRDFLDVGLELTEIAITLNSNGTTTGFTIHIVGDMQLTENPVDFSVSMNILSRAAGFDCTITGQANVGSATFNGLFQTSAAPDVDSGRTWRVHLGWEDQTNPLGFEAMADSLGFELPPIPPTLDLNLVQASFDYDSGLNQFLLQADSNTWGTAALFAYQSGTNWVFGYSMNIQRQGQVQDLPLVNLSNIPLLNQVLGPQSTLSIDLKALVTSGSITAEEAARINEKLNAAVQLPSQGFKGQFGFSISLNVGGTIVPISMGMEGDDVADQRSTPAGTAVGPQTSVVAQPVAPAPAAADDGTYWVNVQKAIGPLFVEKVGVRYEAGELWFSINANLQMAGFSASVIGLRVGTALDHFEPDFGIDGLGLDFKTAGFELGGALLNMHPAEGFQFAGIAIAKAFGISGAIMGTYGQVTVNRQTVTTMFLFGQLSGLTLGQPYFMVTALAGGVGYNSALRLPAANEVGQFPFVAGLSDPSKLGGAGATPMQVLNKIMTPTGGQRAWISSSPGDFWVAAGLSFNSFNLIQVSALASVQFGNDLTVGLIGMATAQFPKPVTPTTPVLLSIELYLAATYRQSEGLLAITAQLGPASFILSSAVHLTGGFAFYSWFRGVHAGDFVMTVGGYHSRFTVPTWYPAASAVPRLGINWNAAPGLTVTGGMYMAMTPSAMMFGGSLDMNYVDGPLRAWFSASFEALIQYVPFSFDVTVGVTVGVSYTHDTWYCSDTHRAQLGANMRLIGPPVGGSVKIDWTIFSFTVSFGAALPKSNSNCPTTDWTTFQTLLPPAGKYATLTADTGLVGNFQPAGAAAGSIPEWLVAGDGFAFTSLSALPLSVLAVNDSAGHAAQTFTAAAINIRPMGKTGLKSLQNIWVWFQPATATTPTAVDLNQWTRTAVYKTAPSSLWGSGTACPALPTTASPALLGNQLMGVQIKAPAATDGIATGVIPAANLLIVNGGVQIPMLLMAGTAASGRPITAPSNSVSIVTGNVTAAADRRTQVWNALQGLGFDLGNASPGTPPHVTTGIQDYFVQPPLITTATP